LSRFLTPHAAALPATVPFTVPFTGPFTGPEATERRTGSALRARLAAIARASGLLPLPSATNFVTIDCGRDGDHARRILAALGRLGVFIRMPGTAPLDRCIRISVGRDEDLDILAETLPAARAAAG